MRNEVTHVFQKECLWLFCFQNAYDFKKDGSPRICKSFLFAGNAKGLARESGTENVKVGYVVWVYGHDVFGKIAVEQLRGYLPEIGFVSCTGKFVLFTGEYAGSPCIVECQVKSADTGKEVYECYGLLPVAHMESVPGMVSLHNRKKCRKGTFARHCGKGV